MRGVAFLVVSDPSAKVKELDQIARTHKTQAGRTARGFNPIDKNDVALFKAVMNGAHHVRGFTNKDLRAQLLSTDYLRGIANDEKRASAKAGRILHRLHQHALIAKIPRSRKWRTTGLGRRLMATAIQVREINFPQLLALAA